MNEQSDHDLLAEFVRSNSEEAFSVLVRRHLNLVHSVARRHSSTPHAAEDISQAVFILLARKASTLGSATVLSGWLYTTATLTAANFQRAEARRRRREQEAFMQSTLHTGGAGVAWTDLEPHLDGAMAELRSTDRDAVILRFFENKSLHEVSEALGIEERAAQKRVHRSVEKLRRVLSRRGVTASGAALTEVISTHSIQAATHALVKTISATASKGSAIAVSTQTLVKGTLKTMAWTKAKAAAGIAMGAVVAVVAVGVAAAVIHHHSVEQVLWSVQADHEAKLQAERAGGPGYRATPDTDKAEAELNARRARKN